MKTIATLGPSVRLVVFQYHVKNAGVPEGIPKYSDFHKTTARQFEGTGVRIMEPVTDVLSDFIAESDYQLIDAWHNTEEEDWSRSVVRFVFCHKEYVNSRLRPDFIAQHDSLLESFNGLAGKNLWKTMIHINPFFSAGKRTKKTVLMLDCNSRKQTTKLVRVNSVNPFPELIEVVIDTTGETPIWEEVPVTVFQGGREKLGRGIFNPGIGPKVLLTDKASRLKVNGNDVVLMDPAETIEEPDPIPYVMT